MGRPSLPGFDASLALAAGAFPPHARIVVVRDSDAAARLAATLVDACASVRDADTDASPPATGTAGPSRPIDDVGRSKGNVVDTDASPPATGAAGPSRPIDDVGRSKGNVVDAVVALQPTRWGPLIPQLERLSDALPQGGLALVTDVVWRTAPTPELARAFAPEPGLEKVRPVEGYEMQIDHAGFAIVKRVDFKRDAWLDMLAKDDPRRDALEGDARNAAMACAWLLRKA